MGTNAALIPNSGTIHDIKTGRDVKLSNVEVIAKLLRLELDLQTASWSPIRQVGKQKNPANCRVLMVVEDC